VSTPAAAILGCAGTMLTRDEARFFADAQPWGYILFARNIDTPDQVRALTADLRDAAGRDAPILIDQEGGRVQRMRGPLWRDWRPALDHVRMAGENAARAMYLRARLIAHELYAIGIDANCTPLADVAQGETHPFLLNRLYGDTPDTVAAIARAVAEGQGEGGVLSVLKHLPGHGRATVDSHLDLPRVTAPRADLDAVDFAAFAPLADLPMGMTAHIVFDAIDPDRPATLSPRVIDLIRHQIGFDGLLMTDDLSMQALPGPMGDRASRAIAAGCDIVLHCNGDRAEMTEVLENCGTLDGPAASRAGAALAARRAPAPLDIDAAERDLASLLSGAVYV
jgi:beta-N-acetylhexosaminidase